MERKTKSVIEKGAATIFTCCALISIIAVITITAYMIISGTPAIKEVGLVDILFGTVWSPSSTNPKFGILYIILTSIGGTCLAVFIGVPIGLLSAVFLSEIASPKMREILKSVVELLAGIPSIIYGLLGIMLICPIIYHVELFIFKNDPSHQFTGGANFISAVLVLTLMILPTLINMTETALKAVPMHYRTSSLALGASKIQTIFKVVIPSAKNGIMSAIVLGIGRAIGETMAVLCVAGNAINLPYPFNSVRFLTTAIATEMSYSEGLHREVLFTIGLVLFVFIMIVNIALSYIIKKGDLYE